MSGFYSASQFDHAFTPKKLQNWRYGTSPFPGKHAICSPIRCGATGFIACDNGHLCPCSSRNCCTSPWGDYGLHEWELNKPCCCIDMLRHPELYRPVTDIYITKIPICPKKKCRKPSCPVDPCCFAQMGRGPCCQLNVRTMVGDKCTLKTRMLQERRNMKRMEAARSKRLNLRRRGGPTPITFRFAMGCSPEMCQTCKKPDWRF